MPDVRCPMCGSSELYEDRSTQFTVYAGQSIVVDLKGDPRKEELEIYFNPRVCTRCGFTAMHAEDMELIRGLPEKEGWERIATSIGDE